MDLPDHHFLNDDPNDCQGMGSALNPMAYICPLG